jgi:molecular chaperone GrpE (heat shock protein)
MFGFLTKADVQNLLKQDVLSGVEKICSEEISSIKDSLASLKDSYASIEDSYASMKDFLASSKESLSKSLTESLGESLGESLNGSLSSLAERFSGVEELEQQAQRQERRRQTALETILENQNKILEKLESPPPLEALETLAENLTLAYLAHPSDREFSILYGKLTDLLACFGLSLVADEGDCFDPERHEACAALCNRAYPENSILEVVRPGFLLKGKVLRCATVIVNRYDAKPADSGQRESLVGPPLLYRNQNVEWEGKLYD